MIGSLILGGASMLMSSMQAKDNAKQAQRSLIAKAKADTAARVASAKSTMAMVSSQNTKVEEIQRAKEIMVLQGKADSVMRQERYNDTASQQIVIGIAQGKVTGSGSFQAIFDKSAEDAKWDELWNTNSVTISEAAMEKDKVNILEAGRLSLLTGQLTLGAQREASMAGGEATASAGNQAMTNTLYSGVQSGINNYGGLVLKEMGIM